MRLLFTGRGTSGSFQIRGHQLGEALGATIQPDAQQIEGFAAVVVVKRAGPALLDRIHRLGVPLVWDIVDAWPQPVGNDWTRDECMAWLQQQVGVMRPTALVAATRQMAEDCARFGLPVLALPHHARPGLQRARIRPLAVVGYEGGPQHLGWWAHWLEAECRRRGWRFVINPPDIAAVDVLVALRGRTGYAPRHWKSNVKLANAQAAGVPIVCAREAGYMETASGAEMFADDEREVSVAFDALQPAAVRAGISGAMREFAPQLGQVAGQYRTWLREVVGA